MAILLSSVPDTYAGQRQGQRGKRRCVIDKMHRRSGGTGGTGERMKWGAEEKGVLDRVQGGP